jgi:undecaprenyl-diphosphatase
MGVLEDWSAFPSDHGALFIGLVTGLFFVSRRLGWFSLVYVSIFIMIPRLYSGFHYPTDIIAGAALGIMCVGLTNVLTIKYDVTRPALKWVQKHPPSFYACFFLFTFQVATLFDGTRTIVGIFKDLIAINPP